MSLASRRQGDGNLRRHWRSADGSMACHWPARHYGKMRSRRSRLHGQIGHRSRCWSCGNRRSHPTSQCAKRPCPWRWNRCGTMRMRQRCRCDRNGLPSSCWWHDRWRNPVMCGHGLRASRRLVPRHDRTNRWRSLRCDQTAKSATARLHGSYRNSPACECGWRAGLRPGSNCDNRRRPWACPQNCHRHGRIRRKCARDHRSAESPCGSDRSCAWQVDPARKLPVRSTQAAPAWPTSQQGASQIPRTDPLHSLTDNGAPATRWCFGPVSGVEPRVAKVYKGIE